MSAASPATDGILAPAKINLNLKIVGRREDGYHLLDSMVVFTAFGDRILVQPSPQDSITIDGPFGDMLNEPPFENICAKALTMFRLAGGRIGPLAIHIRKDIPVGAGLGGGSSNAAALLGWLQENADGAVPDVSLSEIALSLGADVPACLAGRALQMTGIGETITLMNTAPHGRILLASPRVFMPTKTIFTALAQSDFAIGEGANAVSQSSAGSVAELVARGNDLQPVAIEQAPIIGDLVQQIETQTGCVAAQMTGSGSACFGIFETAEQSDAAAALLAGQGFWTVSTRF